MAISVSDILEIILVAALGAYLIVGLVVVLFLLFRGPKWSFPPKNNGMLWEQKDHERNIRWWAHSLTVVHPIAFVLQLLVWPFWFMSYLDELEAKDEETPPQYLGPADDDSPRGPR